MGLFYKVSDKELLKIRNEVFVEKGIPALEKNGFQKSPFPNSWFGKDDYGDYSYEFCRLSGKSILEIIIIDIVKGDNWIKVFLNIFELEPELDSLDFLAKIDGIQFDLPPNSRSKMRLREDDYKGIPLFKFVHHKIGAYNSSGSLEKRAKQLGNLIGKDLTNIDSFVKRWHEIHQPLVTTWEGHPVK